jgi:hypothetical protein
MSPLTGAGTGAGAGAAGSELLVEADWLGAEDVELSDAEVAGGGGGDGAGANSGIRGPVMRMCGAIGCGYSKPKAVFTRMSGGGRGGSAAPAPAPLPPAGGSRPAAEALKMSCGDRYRGKPR